MFFLEKCLEFHSAQLKSISLLLGYLVFLFTYSNGKAQAGFKMPDEGERNALQKLETKRGKLWNFHSGILPYQKKAVAEDLWEATNQSHEQDREEISGLLACYADVFLSDPAKDSLLKLNPEPLWNVFYKDGRHFYSHYDDYFSFTADPVIQFGTGLETNQKQLHYLNQRGVELNAHIDQKFSARLFLLETQQSAFHYVQDYEQLYAAFPGAGRYKNYSGKVIKLDRGFDYLLSEGELSCDVSRHVNISLGHGKHFLGHGQRSLFLSDFTAPYLYLKLQTNVWKLNYQNIYAELNSEAREDRGDRLLPKKYMAAHILSAHLTKRWSLGLFESVIFGRENQFEFQYLNPVILYRFVEQTLGSPDNAFLGLQSRYLLNKSTMLYGQIVFDEFLFKEFIKFSGWWGNKYGVQLGLKYFDVLKIRDLDMLAEWNMVRPFTYTFRDSVANYTHYHQALAHPLGANFSEWIWSLSYQADEKVNLQFSMRYFQKGLDTDSLNFGGNILKDYDTRIGDTENVLLQGNKQKVMQLKLTGTYTVFPQAWLDLGLYLRNETLDKYKQTFVWFQLGFRMTISRQSFEI